MASNFHGFCDKDFEGIKGTNWRGKVGRIVEMELNGLLKKKTYRRIPYMWSSIYWGSQQDFKEDINSYCYSKFFTSIDTEEKVLKVGLYFEKGFEDRLSVGKKDINKVYMLAREKRWDWYRFKELLKTNEFPTYIQRLVNRGYKFDICINGDLSNPISLKDIKGISKVLDLWKENNDYYKQWGDFFIYKTYMKNEIIDMGSSVIDEIIEIFKEVRLIYDSISYI